MSFEQFKGEGPIPGHQHGGDPLRDPAGYRAGPELANAVNVALALNMPLLVTGEPGTGKTQLAFRIAAELGLGAVLRFDTKSSAQAHELFYHFDTVRQFGQSQLQALRQQEMPAPASFLRLNALGEAIVRTLPRHQVLAQLGPGFVPASDEAAAPQRTLVLIDEIDKAPRDFPNDLLNQIENMGFAIPELGLQFQAPRRTAEEKARLPVVLITSNSERQLPEPFLRRCVYHHIEFPAEPQALQAILDARLAGVPLAQTAFREAVDYFFALRSHARINKKPSTSELLDWLRVLQGCGIAPQQPLAVQAPLALGTLGSLLKAREDVALAKSLFPGAAARG
jgi:MoxR-like ATPase